MRTAEMHAQGIFFQSYIRYVQQVGIIRRDPSFFLTQRAGVFFLKARFLWSAISNNGKLRRPLVLPLGGCDVSYIQRALGTYRAWTKLIFLFFMIVEIVSYCQTTHDMLFYRSTGRAGTDRPACWWCVLPTCDVPPSSSIRLRELCSRFDGCLLLG